ncbi:MAG: ABC transporter permease [Roseburia sp.]|nr:ABC transporter permease [Anaeroplasma bactoclasticum]MCM1195462.1 ABC transporter permease [Roseburia sp.]
MADFNQNTEFDLSGYQITKDDFKFVQENKAIKDEKFLSKPTTFFKDCLRRFRKNKSSVVGAIVLGILILLAIFLPIFSSSNIDTPSPSETLLSPKLFDSGTGFWDGCENRTHVVYDLDNEIPANYQPYAVFNVKRDENPSYIDSANKFAKGGYLKFVNENTNKDTSDLSATKKLLSQETTFTADGNMKATIKFGNVDNLSNDELGEYRIYISYKKGLTYSLDLVDYSKNHDGITVDISKALKDAGFDTLNNARFGFELKAGNQKQSYILIESCILSCDDTVSENIRSDFEEISIKDATQSVLYSRDETTLQFPKGYWSCTGQKNIYHAAIYYCSFKLDTYAQAYADVTKTVAISELYRWASLGYCTYNESVGPSSFKKLSDKCPINEVYSQETNRIGKVISIEANVTRYKELGYDSMPKFLFGTDEQGHDIVKKAFAGLRTSLILGVCTAAFCLFFGLCWGAISGYFGGNVDLAMERFCDILGGIPTIIVLTLAIMHLGNNFGTFVIALCLTGWMGTAARTRTQFYRFKGREYVLASRTLGASDFRLIFRHILPNSLGTIVTGSVLMIPSVIYSEATLAYLNLGLQGMHSFGVMLSDNQKFIETHPALIVFPSVIMALMMISFNLFGNGLRDALNPSLKGSD